MATKKPAPWDVLQHLNELIDASGVKGEVDKSARTLAQSALSKLDVVSREEFDAQTEVLRALRAKVTELEAELEALTQELETLSTKS
ncbi:MAG: accessory factor UbiK family protein [Pseudomonadota bacterium]